VPQNSGPPIYPCHSDPQLAEGEESAILLDRRESRFLALLGMTRVWFPITRSPDHRIT
jgi:hypothetical protein